MNQIRPSMRNLAAALAVGTLLSTSACATRDTPEQAAAVDETNDPLEPLNRYLFEVNFFLDEVGFKPLGAWYRAGLPDFVQDRIRNALWNMSTPWTAINDLLQGEWDRAYSAIARFGINTTAGALGLFDVATDLGYPRHVEDFGQTLAVWGLPEGPYLVLPVLGPSNPRDAVGGAVDSYGDPVNLYARIRDWSTPIPLARSAAEGTDLRSRNIETLDDLRRDSVDYYAAIRSLVRQRRDSEIRNGAPTDEFPTPLASDSPWLTATPTTSDATPKQ
jgi:phospholipid-binding lipoprotein MlaA